MGTPGRGTTPRPLRASTFGPPPHRRRGTPGWGCSPRGTPGTEDVVDDTRRLPPAARSLIALMAVAGGISVLARSPDVASWRTADLITCVVLIAGVTLTELYRIPLRHRTETLNFSVTEALWAGALVLARPSVLTVAVAAGVFLSQAIRRQPGYKLAFNIGQFTVSLTVAQVLYGALNPAGAFTSRAWIAAG